MTTPTAQPSPAPHMIQRLIILVLAGLLIFYHTTMLYDFVRGQLLSNSVYYDGMQSVLRVAIITSLTLVVLGKRFAIWTMWLSIGGLIATHYWAHFGLVEAGFTVERHLLSYLKGLIIPSIITASFLYHRR